MAFFIASLFSPRFKSTKQFFIINASPLKDLAIKQNFIVSLTSTEKGKKQTDLSYCSGVLIAPHIVLTAAHCVHEKTQIVIHFHDQNGKRIFDQSYVLQKQKIIIHKGYKKLSQSTVNDIALIQLPPHLSTSVEKFPEILPEMLLDINSSSIHFLAIGSGLKSLEEKNDIFRGEILQYKYLKTENYQINKNTFSVLQPEGGVCFGDSGGPALIKDSDNYYLLGIASYLAATKNKSQNVCQMKSYFLNMSAYKKWILQNIQMLSL